MDALIVMDVQLHDPRLPLLRTLDLPSVLIGFPSESAGLTCIDLDFKAAGELCVERLAAPRPPGASPWSAHRPRCTYAGPRSPSAWSRGCTAAADRGGLSSSVHPCEATAGGGEGGRGATPARAPGVDRGRRPQRSDPGTPDRRLRTTRPARPRRPLRHRDLPGRPGREPARARSPRSPSRRRRWGAGRGPADEEAERHGPRPGGDAPATPPDGTRRARWHGRHPEGVPCRSCLCGRSAAYSTVTDFARFRGWSTRRPGPWPAHRRRPATAPWRRAAAAGSAWPERGSGGPRTAPPPRRPPPR